MLRQAKQDQRVAPLVTALPEAGPQLAVPIRYKALSVLRFWLFSASLDHSDVKTLKFFSTFVSARLIKISAPTLILVVFTKK